MLRISKPKNNDKEEYFEGYAFAYSRVISLLIQQAEVYNIPLSELGLDDIEVEKDLLLGV